MNFIPHFSLPPVGIATVIRRGVRSHDRTNPIMQAYIIPHLFPLGRNRTYITRSGTSRPIH